MPKTIHTITHQDGTVSTRTSANRVYPFAVVIGPAAEKPWRKFHLGQAKDFRDRAKQLRWAVERGKFWYQRRTTYGTNTSEPFTCTLVGSGTPEQTSRCDSDHLTETTSGTVEHYGLDVKSTRVFSEHLTWLLVDVEAYLLAGSLAQADYYDRQADRLTEEAEQPSEGFSVLSWHSTLALANKAAQSRQALYQVGLGRTVTVVPTDRS